MRRNKRRNKNYFFQAQMLVNKLGRLQMPQMNRIKSAAHNAKLFALHSFTHLPYYHYIIPKTGKLAQLYVNNKSINVLS
jgi:hypothetical protein